ncbi:MAG: hypothetical protein CSA52_00865 [Gammaproteobacteria bacterium]|nr:MAG: hypothetical protein CSB48_08190 [Pseudomonadota bacterium]PIE38850.1 MAG: hypothetical protein CSA52_00865 [Gammaproteobacteria bacterium]
MPSIKSLTPALSSIVLFLFGSIAACSVSAQTVPEDQWRTLNRAVIDQHIMPRYQNLAEKSALLEQQTERFCHTPDRANLNSARASFKAALKSWQGVQHIQFGPVTLLMRNYSLQYWPDKKNTGGRQLKAALKLENPVFDEEFFRSASVSLKGFPALERLLFGKTVSVRENKLACSLATAIARNIHTMSRSIREEWKEEARQIELAGKPHDGAAYQVYETPSEAATELMKSLVEPVEAIRDNKILRPLSKTIEKSRWSKSESWRSGQSIENIRQNLAALHELYSGTSPVSVKALLEAAGDKSNAQAIEEQFRLIRNEIDTASPVTGPTLTEAGYRTLSHIARQLKILDKRLALAMQTLNIRLGFNSRDGD